MNICRLFSTRPQSLGEGMRRVVCAAGGTKEAHLQTVAHDTFRNVRKYTNGVVLDHNELSTNVYSPLGKLRAFISTAMSKKYKFFVKHSGWIDGKQKYVSKRIDINGNFVDKIVIKGKNVLKNKNLFGRNYEDLAKSRASYEHDMEILSKETK